MQTATFMHGYVTNYYISSVFQRLCKNDNLLYEASRMEV